MHFFEKKLWKNLQVLKKAVPLQCQTKTTRFDNNKTAS